MAAGQGEFGVPAPEDEARLWSLVETAWALLGPEVRQARQELVVRPPGSRADVSVVAGALRAFLDIMAGHCRDLPADALTSLDRVVERGLGDRPGRCPRGDGWLGRLISASAYWALCRHAEARSAAAGLHL